jgi:hypothetical protein
MTPTQKQIVIGTILGGSSLIRPKKGINFYLAMASNDPTWLAYKMEELSQYFPKKTLSSDHNTYRCTSSCSEIFSSLYNDLYKNGSRYVSKELLDGLRDIALAIWFLDGGGKTGRGQNNAYLNVTRLYQSIEEIQFYFNDMGMSCNLNSSQGRNRLVFSVEGTNRLLKTIAHRFPNFMSVRL